MKPFFQIENRTLVAGMVLALVSSLPAWAADINVPAQQPTIQAAVNAASSGDTIHIAPGIYVEQVAITNKNLTLAGTPGAVIRANGALVQTTPHHCTVTVLAIVRSDVVVKGLTFEGEHLAEGYTCSYGAITFDGGSGRVEDCIVRGFRAANSLFGFNGFGVVADNYEVSLVNVQVLRCTFADNGLSVHVRGSDGANDPVRLTFTIADNVITGIGTTTLGSQRGIMISAGASGDVLRNTIADHSFSGETDTSFGIYAVDWLFDFGSRTPPIALKPVRYEGNTLRNNQLHLASALGHGSQFVNNTFEGAGGTNARLGGLALSGSTNQVSGNHFSHMPTGLTLVGNDPVFGTVFGIATNPVLTSNRFCNVTTPIVTQPLVTGVTNQGTLVCPFLPPTLAIAPAVLLTWPAIESGYVVECATNAAAPWLPLGIAPTVIGNEATVAVKTTDAAKFFRLKSQ